MEYQEDLPTGYREELSTLLSPYPHAPDCSPPCSWLIEVIIMPLYELKAREGSVYLYATLSTINQKVSLINYTLLYIASKESIEEIYMR